MNITRGFTQLINEYRISLKAPAGEELIDLFLFRPAAFVVAKLFHRSPIRPTHVTLSSLVGGVGGGFLLGVGEQTLVLASVLIGVSTMLDCADGQLARLQNSASSMGRILDGVIDYVVGLSVFAGIALRGNPAFAEGSWWSFVGVAAMSYALQAMMYDLFRTEYLSSIGRSRSSETERLRRSALSPQPHAGILTRFYEHYSALQDRLGTWLGSTTDDPATRLHLRLWGLNGTSTHTAVLIAAALLNQLEWYLLYIVVFGNILMLTLMVLRHQYTKRTMVQTEVLSTLSLKT